MENNMKLFKFILIAGIITICSGVYAQVNDTTAVTTSGDDFVDLSEQATIIKVEPEKPRVTLITERIKPQFMDVNLNKSFLNEILSKNDKTFVENKMIPEERTIIDVDKFVNKNR
jgi:hypothetical protein